MIVPPFPVEASGDSSYHALWPGMQPTDDSFVYQNVVDDWYPSQKNLRWDVSTWYGPDDAAGDYVEYQTYPVTVGDSITTDFQFHMPSGTWTETQIIEPGASGTTAGESPSAATINVAFKNFPNNAAILTQFLFVIELQGAATWNFGPLTFTSIIMTANTTSTAWCSNPVYSGSFTYKNTQPVATVVNGQCQCYVASLTFLAPSSTSAENAPAAVGSTGRFNVTHKPIKV
ncbi:uncharacterized protein LY89DRAFT_738318 [Mollisia scopiformis]|uniref:Uncharacterized protein n=1 Tax=Mollisia scopiformis TaxID=149040 RepID=A0A194WY65_MOLSC|nr:uncharacterized protein LY89DRAFT_738318 [Mollisia scopiformis]KUJ12542.1 hypothetical protein LY89DRAFT_738318 [Mollisia scopiformis]